MGARLKRLLLDPRPQHVFDLQPGGDTSLVTITLPDRADGVIGFDLACDGYAEQFDPPRATIDGDVFEIALQPVPPVRGRVVSQEAGHPVVGARVHGLRVKNREHGGSLRFCHDPRSNRSKPLATTDADGRFTLCRLSPIARYDLVILADGYQPHVLSGIEPGEPTTSQSEIVLAPPLVLSGRAVGDLSVLPVRNGRRMVTYSNPIAISDDESHISATPLFAPVDDAGRFRIGDLSERVVKFPLPKGSFRLVNLKRHCGEYELKLTDD